MACIRVTPRDSLRNLLILWKREFGLGMINWILMRCQVVALCPYDRSLLPGLYQTLMQAHM